MTFWGHVFLGVIAGATLVMALIQVGALLYGWVLARRVSRLVDRIEDRIRPGMASNVEIEVARSPEALTVPIEAVVHRRRKDLPAEMLEQLQVAAEETGSAAVRRSAEYLKIVFTIDGDVAKPAKNQIGLFLDIIFVR